MTASYVVKDFLGDVFTLLKQPRFIRLCLLIRLKYRILYKKKIRFPLRPLWVSPDDIITVVTGNVCPTSALVHPDRLIAGDWDINTIDEGRTYGDLGKLNSGHVAFTETDIYKACEAHFLHGFEWDDTTFFQRVNEQIQKGRRKWRCLSRTDLEKRMGKIDDLYHAMKSHGYKSQREMRTFRCWDEIRIGIGRDGRFHLFDGRHRLALAKILGIKKVPVLINFRHPSWEGDLTDFQVYYENKIS